MALLPYALLFCLPAFALPQPMMARDPEPSIQWIDCRDQVPFTLDTTDINMNALPDTLHCGSLIVPMDYSKSIGKDNNITLGLAMYRPKNPKGVVFFNPGGSDESTVFAWQAALNQSQEFAALTDYDLMMMDTRATYHSNPLNVSLDAFEPFLGSYPASQSEFDVAHKASIELFNSWANASGPPGILEFVGTKETVQDLEYIRKALAYDKINFIGASYGSFRAVQYAATYPDRVQNFVLDAVVPHGIALFEQAQDQIAASNRALFRADAFCHNNSSCPFHGGGKGAVIKAYKKILATANTQPIPAPSCGNTTSCKSTVTSVMIQQGMANALQGDPDFPGIFLALETALNNDASIFATASGDPIPSVADVWAVPIECRDYDLGANDFASFRRSVDAAAKHDLNEIGRTSAWQLQLLCSGWPYATPKTKKLPMPKPMLLVTADFDPSAPTEFTRKIWEQNQDSALAIRHGDDHVSFQFPNQPSSIITSHFINTGELPAAEDETLVSVYRCGMQLRPIEDPYNVSTGAITGGVDID